MSEANNTIADFDAKKVELICHDVKSTNVLVEWMDELIEENVTLQVGLVEGPDEQRVTRLAHIASQISAYRRIKDAAKRALDKARGKKPPERLVPESTESAVL